MAGGGGGSLGAGGGGGDGYGWRRDVHVLGIITVFVGWEGVRGGRWVGRVICVCYRFMCVLSFQVCF